MVHVLEYERIVSLDGIPWDDRVKKKAHYIGFAIRDFTFLKQKDDKKLVLIKSEDIDRVYGAMALRMYDSDLLTGAFHSIADGNTPIVFNNSCNSWKEMSKSFIFGGAIVYIGTLFPVTDIEAKELTNNLFSKNIGRQLAFSLWRAQKQTYNSLRHPYVMVGPHFIKINSPKVKTAEYLLTRLLSGKKSWEEKSKKGIDEGVKRNSKVLAEFLDKEINAYVQYFQSINKP